MKLYKEMLRKLMPVGLPLLIVTMVFTLLKGGSDCFGAFYLAQSTSAISQVYILRYYVFTAIFFALQGFSFQFSRAGSDVYHSLPIKRTQMYAAVLLATATWMGATIILNELVMLIIYLVSGCPFVPVYILLPILYYFVASMLVFTAAAIGCSVSGTIITALASTGIVLLLPRYIQFLFARGIVERVPLVGWLDFGVLLDPTTNAATGILAMQLRNVYNGHLITLPHILYSLIPLTVMLIAGLWLFKRRPSEIAQKNGGYRAWTIITAIMLAFTVLMPITMNEQRLFSTYGFILTAAAFGVFIVYQLIVSTKVKKALVSLPFFLIAVMAVLAVSGLIQTAADSMLNTTPAASEIESVTFRGYDYKTSDPTYTTHVTQDIEFVDEETKAYVAQALEDAVDEILQDAYTYVYEYNQYAVIEPIEIKLSNGATIKRTIEFDDINELNALRLENQAYAEAVHAFPPLDSVQYLLVEEDFTQEEEQTILEAYLAEAQENGLLNGYYYRDRMQDILPNGNYAVLGDNQILTSIISTGYVGQDRYNDTYPIRLNTPETASLLMRTYNDYAGSTSLEQIAEVIKRFDDGNAGENDEINLSIAVFNYESEDGCCLQENTYFYLGYYMLESEMFYHSRQLEYMRRFIDVLSSAVLTDDPEGVFIRLNWYYHNEALEGKDYDYVRPSVFLRFDNEADEQEFLDLFKEWEYTQNYD